MKDLKGNKLIEARIEIATKANESGIDCIISEDLKNITWLFNNEDDVKKQYQLQEEIGFFFDTGAFIEGGRITGYEWQLNFIGKY